MNWTDSRCGKTVPGGRAEHCTVCHHTFSGSNLGDAHRVGPHDNTRRCLTEAEMRAKGWRLTTRPGGAQVWSGPELPADVLARIAGTGTETDRSEDLSHFQPSGDHLDTPADPRALTETDGDTDDDAAAEAWLESVGTACHACGKDPADGFAFAGDHRYCHGDDGPSCYINRDASGFHGPYALYPDPRTVTDVPF